MKTILLIKGTSQYAVLRYLTDLLAQAFNRLDRKAIVVDLLEPNFERQLQAALGNDIDFVLGFNGWAINAMNGSKSLWDEYGIPFVAAFVDSPIYHWDRLWSSCTNLLATFVDQTHRTVMTRLLGIYRPAIFWPHAACEGPPSLSPVERTIDVLFSGSIGDPQDSFHVIHRMPPDVAAIIEQVLTIAETEHRYDLEEIAIQVLANAGIAYEPCFFRLVAEALVHVSFAVRNQRRIRGLKALAAANFRVSVFGNGWNNISGLEGIDLHDPVEFPELLHLMQRAKIVLHMNPNFPRALHERFLSALASGAAVVSDANPYIQEVFRAGEAFEMFSWRSIEALPEIVSSLLKNTNRRKELGHAAQLSIRQNHTWIERAKALLAFVEAQRTLL